MEIMFETERYTWLIFIEIAIRKSAKNDEGKSKAGPRYDQLIARKARSKVACDVIESVNFAEFHGFYDVTGNFELDFQAIGWLYVGAALDFSSSFL